MKFKLAIELELTSSMGGWVDVVVDGWWILLNYGLLNSNLSCSCIWALKSLIKIVIFCNITQIFACWGKLMNKDLPLICL